jgi:hypothetical protein
MSVSCKAQNELHQYICLVDHLLWWVNAFRQHVGLLLSSWFFRFSVYFRRWLVLTLSGSNDRRRIYQKGPTLKNEWPEGDSSHSNREESH